MPTRNKSYPWDPDYFSWPHQRSAYDFWEYDTRRMFGAQGVYNNARHVPGEMDAGDYVDINKYEANNFFGEEAYEFHHQETAGGGTLLPPTDRLVNHHLTHGHDHNIMAHSATHSHYTGGEGRRPHGKPDGSCDYCGGWQLDAIHPLNEYNTKCCPPLDQAIGCTNCTSFMTKDCCCLTENNPLAIGQYSQESAKFSLPSLNTTGDILALLGILFVIAIVAKIIFF